MIEETIQLLQTTVNQHSDSILKLSNLIEKLEQTVKSQDETIAQLENQVHSLRFGLRASALRNS
jgi:hypothetical protein